jgi:mono/diheme cytochrome c family protein
MRFDILRPALFSLAAAVLLSVNSTAATPPAADTFKAKCAGCHGPDGSGDTTMGKSLKVRDLRSAEVQKQTDAELQAVITTGKKVMPAFGKTLEAAQIRELIPYLRTLAKKN